jgi:DNA-binding transcriptional LysR family regulator
LNGLEILTPGESSQIQKSFVSLCRENSVTPIIMCSCSQIHFLLQLTCAGIGLTVLPEILLQSLPPELAHRPLSPALPWELVLISPNNVLPLSVSTVISFIQNYFHSPKINGNEDLHTLAPELFPQ